MVRGLVVARVVVVVAVVVVVVLTCTLLVADDVAVAITRVSLLHIVLAAVGGEENEKRQGCQHLLLLSGDHPRRPHDPIPKL